MEYVTHAPHSARPIGALAAGGRREYVGRIWFVRLFHGSSQPDDSAQLYRRLGDFESAEYLGFTPGLQMVGIQN